MVFCFRFLLCKKNLKALLFGLLQDFFVAAELNFLPRWSVFPFFLYQFFALFLASRLKLRLAPSHFFFFKSARPILNSAKEIRFFPWLAAFTLVFFLLPHELPEHVAMAGLFVGPLAAYFCRHLDTETELLAHNALFYLQWKWWIHPKRKKREDAKKNYFQPQTRRKQRILIRHKKKPNIIFLFLESFRAKNIGSLGSSLSASPCFDELAKQGVLFTRCYSTGVYTFNAAIASLFGVPAALNTMHLRPYMNIAFRGLPQFLKKRGYKSFWIEGGFTSFCGTHPFLKEHGFDEVLGAEEIKTGSMSWGVHDDELFSFAIRLLKEKRKDPFFATLFTLTNHHPWKAPKGWRFDSPLHLHPIYGQFLQTYSYTDACLGAFIQKLKEEKLLENTLLFITADHGQNENEISRSNLSESNIHVPLLIYGEGIKGPYIEEEICSHVDLFSTVLDLLDIEDPQGLGKNLLKNSFLSEEVFSIEKSIPEEKRIVNEPMLQPSYFSMPGAISLRGCRSGPWKWVGLANGKEAKLFHMENDPQERVNVSISFPQIEEELKDKTLSLFEEIEALLEKKEKLPSEMLQVENISDEELAHILKTPFSTVDFSASRKITNRSIFRMVEKSGPLLRYLIMPKSALICDKALFAIGEYCPNLTAFFADDLPLITSRGVETILERCPLKLLSLKGMEDVKTIEPKVGQLALSSLFLGEGIQLDGKRLLSLLRKCPMLTNLQVDLSQVGREELEILVTLFTDLQEVRFANGIHLTQKMKETLLKNNKDLKDEL